ncbi:sodium-dependent glucose transporter 1A-like [Ruditapes philippinarum]|uniref:sodium-dependent glucose transporter 1A-like n=1 Tax=Ruditapes philippinarum TaxID=129788 RepID=UPI00295AF585|nr:sodium-dependent glucose transporter 1A-like [Ruditapes philippinarum]XP_060573643.1 sodium-dependent glucose transporter 1A-like [Ruditapes philippinarum]
MEKDKDSQTDSKPQRSTCEKVVETGFLVATWLALGLYLEIFGPTLIDLKIKLNTDYEKVAVAVSGRSVGMFPGCVFGGFLVDKFGKYCHLMLAVCLEIAAVVTVIIPWSPNVELLWFLCFVGGFVESVVNIAGQRRILTLWQEKAATPMILLHSGYGFGSFLIPLYTNPFLAVKREDIENTTLANANITSTTAAYVMPNSTVPEYIKESKIEYSYAISAVLVALHSLSFYVFQIHERRYETFCSNGIDKVDTSIEKQTKGKEIKDRNFTQLINPATCAGGRLWYGIQLFALLFFYFANVGGGERVIAGFVRSFSIDQLNFSKDDGSYVNTSFWISFLVGRIGFSIAARWISVRILVLVQSGGLTVVAILMTIFARNSALAYWILIQPLAICLAPLWPSGVAWADFHLELTGIGMMTLLLGGSVGGIGHLRLIGYLYEHVAYYTFLYQVLGYAILSFVLAIVLDLIGSQHGSRFQWDNNENDKEVVEMKTAEEKYVVKSEAL